MALWRRLEQLLVGFFWHWTEQDYYKMHPAKQGMVESGENLSIMLILQAGWRLQREPPAIPAGSPLAD